MRLTALPRCVRGRSGGKVHGMDTFRLNSDAVRRALPESLTEDIEPEETERLADRVREVAPAAGAGGEQDDDRD
jgi:hypothetical protein